MSGERLARVTHLLHDYVDRGRLPGTDVQIVRHGEVVLRDVYGWADLDEERRLADDSIYRIYSMTKPITSVALMMLVEEGRVLLENPVSRFIPELGGLEVWTGGDKHSWTTEPARRDMTVHDVLTHVSGLTIGFQYQHPLDALYRQRALGDFAQLPDYDLAECMALLAELPLICHPGDRYHYGMATDVVARIVEVVSGLSFDRFLAERIFEPLGMHDTGFHADDGDRLVAMYGRDKGKKLRRLQPGPASYHTKPPRFLSGTGGLVSTLDDYQRFCDVLLGGGEAHGVRLLGPRTLATMTMNHLPEGKTLVEMEQDTFSEAGVGGEGFGLGFYVVVDPPGTRSIAAAGEYGWGGAASTAFWIDPEADMSVILMTHLMPSATYPIRRQLRHVVNQAVID